MAHNRIVLDTAAFLDSRHAAALSEIPEQSRRAIVERFLACAYDDVGKAPHLLDGQDLHQIVGHLLPARFARKDPAAVHVAPVLHAFLDHLAEQSIVSHAYELRRALDETAPELEEAVRTGREAHHAPHQKTKPFVHRAEKTGRNDPCPCGSGKKFKKCCAELGA